MNTTPNEAAPDSGAAYVFVRNSGVWTQQAYLKAFNTGSSDDFGISVAIAGDKVVVAANLEDSSTTGVNSTPNENAANAGAAYVFVRNSGVWTQQAYLKASNTGANDTFGNSVAISGDTVVVSTINEDSNTTGVNTTPNESAPNSGAAYIFNVPSPCGTGRSLSAGQWTMFSLPCAADAPSTVSSVFSGVTGTYNTDWVVYERDEANNRYTKLDLNSPLTQGDGYWFKSLNAAQFSVSGTTTPVTTSADCPSVSGCFEITLTKPSNADGLYTLAGHPFPDSVDWANVRVVADGGSAASPSQADSNGDMSKNYWVWNGSGYDSFDDVTPGLVGTLQPAYGMWVKVLKPNLSSIKLLIPGGPVAVAPLAGIIKKAPLKPAEWYVRLVAEAPAVNLKDRGNVLGQLKDSKLGLDSHDLPELAPSFTPYLTVVFPGERASDFHPVKAGTDIWSFVVRTDNLARQVRLSWEVSGQAPANMSLKDLANGQGHSTQSRQLHVRDGLHGAGVHVECAVTSAAGEGACPPKDLPNGTRQSAYSVGPLDAFIRSHYSLSSTHRFAAGEGPDLNRTSWVKYGARAPCATQIQQQTSFLHRPVLQAQTRYAAELACVVRH